MGANGAGKNNGYDSSSLPRLKPDHTRFRKAVHTLFEEIFQFTATMFGSPHFFKHLTNIRYACPELRLSGGRL